MRACSFRVDYFDNSQDLFWRVGEHLEAWSNSHFAVIIKHALQVTNEQLKARTSSSGSSGGNAEVRISVAIRNAFFVSAADSQGSDRE